MDEEENFIDSDSSDIEEKHSKLVNSISQLDSTQRVKPASRKEVTSEVSEYNLGKTKKNLVNINELAQVLESKSNHVLTHKKFKKVISKFKTLPKPLEKPVEERLKRTIAFEEVKKQVKKWDAIVARNALKDHMVFPLKDNSMRMQRSSDFFKQFQSSTPLELEISKILKQEKKPITEEENEINNYPLTLEEMIQKRKEMAQLRAKLSYREAKAQYQSKIKSKKFHRILKREKLKQQLKEFEILQKTDPEAALQKLSELDKTRAKERASLRHRNTGQWAKNMTVRAKYDVESRKILADQLKMSRELTQKVQVFESSDEEELNEQNQNIQNRVSKSLIVEKDNPWSLQVSEEVKDFITNHKKYWEEKSNNIDGDENNKENKIKSNSIDEAENEDNIAKPVRENEIEKKIASEKQCIETKSEPPPVSNSEKSIKSNNCGGSSLKNNKRKEKNNKEEFPIKNIKSPKHDIKTNSVCEPFKILTVRPTAGVWLVTSVPKETVDTPKSIKKKRKSENLNTLFNDLEEAMMEKAKKKIKKINKNLKKSERKKRRIVKTEKTKEDFDLSLKGFKTIERPDMDLELLEGVNQETSVENSNAFNAVIPTKNAVDSPALEIDPKNFIRVKPKKLSTYISDNITGGEDAIDNETRQQQAIEEAFCDDDVIAEFEKQKKEENKKREIEITSSLPGWGEWGGIGIKPNPKKKKRFLIAKLPPRKDKGKMDIIINENENPKIRQHMVKEVPHPFKSVDAFEAIIRAPVGRDFVPETAHRKIIQKEIETKLGAVIEPMTEDEIVRLKKSTKCPFEGKKKKNQKHNVVNKLYI